MLTAFLLYIASLSLSLSFDFVVFLFNAIIALYHIYENNFSTNNFFNDEL